MSVDPENAPGNFSRTHILPDSCAKGSNQAVLRQGTPETRHTISQETNLSKVDRR